MTACVFAWEDRARESSVFMREEMGRRTRAWKHLAAPVAR
jgi:myo-inositol catabolism protein IolH